MFVCLCLSVSAYIGWGVERMQRYVFVYQLIIVTVASEYRSL